MSNKQQQQQQQQPRANDAISAEIDCVNDQNSKLLSTTTTTPTNAKKTKRKWKKKRHRDRNSALDLTSHLPGKQRIQNETMYQTMKQFLEERRVCVGQHSQFVYVSLSGGVDSMVISKLLCYLKQFESNFKHMQIIAIHIDYGNRAESNAEATYLQHYCNKHQMVFRERKIVSIKRGITKRDEYEKLSRNIRFDTYKAVVQEFSAKAHNEEDNNTNTDMNANTAKNGVMFGHHRGDIQENVISNMMKGCSLLNVSGMTYESYVNQQLIWRPLLDHNKTDILQFAHTYGVPYFKDSTPRWSNRGRMRNELLPLLKDMFGDGVLHNLSSLAHESRQFNEMAKTQIFEPFWNKMKSSAVAAWVEINGYEHQSLLFWKESLRHMCEDLLGIPRIHEKAIERELLFKFRVNTNTKTKRKTPNSKRVCGWLNLRREYKCYLHQSSVLIIFVPEFCRILPGKQITYDFYVEQGFQFNALTMFQKSHVFGPWHIQFEKANVQLLYDSATQHLVDIFDIIQGKFHYFLPLLNADGLYCIEKNKKKLKKLRSFRGLPSGMRQILPLVLANGQMLKNTHECIKVAVFFQR